MGTPNERPTVDEGAASPERLGKVVPLRVAAQPPPPLEQLVEQTFRIAIGMTALASEVLAEAVARTLGREPFAEGEAPGRRDRPPGLRCPARRGRGDRGRARGRSVGRPRRHHDGSERRALLLAPDEPGVRAGAAPSGGDRLGGLDARWREQRPRDEEAAAAFLRLLVPQVVDAALDQIDLNELVAERIELDRIIDGLDLDRVIGRLDIDAIVARIDLDRIIERIDVQAIVERVPIDEIVSRLDLDAIVASVDLDQVVRRVDIQAVADRIDLQALVRRLDLTAIASEVIEELDLMQLIQDAMGSMTNETVGGIRVQSMNADRAISRLRERLLGRGGGDGPGDDAREPERERPRGPASRATPNPRSDRERVRARRWPAGCRASAPGSSPGSSRTRSISS